MILGFPARDIRILILFAGLTFIGLADSLIITPILPELSEDFRQNVTETNWVVTAYWAGAAIASLLAGPFLDYYGRKRILLVGICIAAVGNAAAAGASSFWHLFAFRFLVGLGSSLASVSHLTYMGDYFPYGIRGKAMGVIALGFFGGFIFGIPLGGMVAETFGWRATLAIFGTVMGALFFGCLFGVSALPAQRSSVRTFIRDAVKLHCARQPVLALVIYACIGASMIGFLAYVGDWLHRQFGYGITGRSQLFFSWGLPSLLFSPLAGIWADRSGKRVPAIAGTALICVLMGTIPLLPGDPLAIYPACMVLAGGVSLRHSPLLTLVTEIVPAARRGTFLAVKNAWTQVGAALGNTIAGLLYHHGGYQAVGLFSCMLTGLTLVLLIGLILEPATNQKES